MVYTSGSISLAVLETLVNVQDPEDIPENLVIVSADLPDDLAVVTIKPQSLPAQWQAANVRATTQELGKKWFIEQQAAVVAVPSVVVPAETNYLINPKHVSCSRIIIHKSQGFRLDPRLMRTVPQHG